MSFGITLPNLKTRNPNLPVPRTSDFGIRNAVFLYDMLTYGSSTVLTDLSGNGFDATFNVAPTTTAEGTVFDGAKYADCASGTQDYNDNITGFFVVRQPTSANSRYAMANIHNTDNNGLGVFLQSTVGWAPKMRHGSSGNDSTGFATGTAQTNIAVNTWATILFKSKNGHGYLENLSSGVVTITRTRGVPFARPWRIGSAYDTGDVSYNVLHNNAVLGFCGLIDAVTTRAQDVAILAYLNEVMAARGVTL